MLRLAAKGLSERDLIVVLWYIRLLIVRRSIIRASRMFKYFLPYAVLKILLKIGIYVSGASTLL